MECISCVNRVTDEPAIAQWNRLWDNMHVKSQNKPVGSSNTPDFLPLDSNVSNGPKLTTNDDTGGSNNYPNSRTPDCLYSLNPENVPQFDPRFTPWKRREKFYSAGVIG